MAHSIAPQKISFQSPSPFELYLPEGPGPFPLLCLTPVLGRVLFLDDLYFERRAAHFFANRGFACALIERPIFEFDPSRGLKQVQEYLEESILRNKKVLDCLVQNKKIDRERIGDYGFSFGAVINALWASQDNRLKAHVFGLAGGDIAEILVTSRDPLMLNYLKAMMKVAGPGKENLKEKLRKIIQLEPLSVCRSIPREDVLMFLAIFDRVVRLRYGLSLWRTLGKPKAWFLPLGHYATILSLPLCKRIALAFFRKRLCN